MEKRILLVLAIVVMCYGTARSAGPVYVNGGLTTGLNDGTSWANAYHATSTADATGGLQSALNDADANGSTVFVAQWKDGSTVKKYIPGTGGFSTSQNNVTIAGGYKPDGSGTRDIDLYETILCGDKNQNDGADIDMTALLTPPTFPDHRGDLATASITVGGTHFDNILVMSLLNKIVTINGFTFKGGNGGSVNCNGTGTAIFQDCTFTQNFSSGNGGCVCATNGTVKFSGCDFIQNSAAGYGSVIYISGTGKLEMTDCFVSVAVNTGRSGAVYLKTGPTDCVISNCVFDRCWTNSATNSYGGFGVMGAYTSAKTLTLTNCIFTNCESYHHGAAVYLRNEGTGALVGNMTNCLVSGSSNYQTGGTNVAVYGETYIGTTPISTTLNLYNCTIMNNHANGKGAVGAYCQTNTVNYATTVNLKNTIVWGNTGDTPANNNVQLCIVTTDSGYSRCAITANYCCLDTSDTGDWGNTHVLGVNNVFTNPQVDSNFMLTAASTSCLGMGNDGYVAGVTTDLAGQPRFNGTVDIGAYEYYPPGDIDGSGKVNLVDFSIFSSHWLDTGCSVGNDWCDQSDINQDGAVNLTDFDAMVTNWLLP